MRFGVAGTNQYQAVKEAGFDYIESSFTSIAGFDYAKINEMKQAMGEYDLKTEAFNCFFPSTIALIGDEVNYDVIREHCKKGFDKAAMLGGEIAVVGSGKARRIPEGFNTEKAKEQFGKVLSICGDEAKQVGMSIVIEPLNGIETNFINTVKECYDFCTNLGNPNVAVLADFYHVFMTGESLDGITASAPLLKHTHLARPNADRRMPTLEEDGEVVKLWAETLKKTGYNGRLSLEGSFKPEFSEAIIEARKVLKYFE